MHKHILEQIKPFLFDENLGFRILIVMLPIGHFPQFIKEGCPIIFVYHLFQSLVIFDSIATDDKSFLALFYQPFLITRQFQCLHHFILPFLGVGVKVILVIVYHLYCLPILTPFYEAVDIMVTDILVIPFLPHQLLCLLTLTMCCPVIRLLNVIAIVEVFLFLVFQPLADMSQIRLFVITAKQGHRFIHKPL